MQIKKELQDIATIQLGHSFRGKIEGDVDGNSYVIQAKDTRDNLLVQDISDLIPVLIKDTKRPREVKQGDVLLLARGALKSGFRAAVFQGETDLPVIASSTLYMLSLTDDRVISEYLAIYLNSSDGQRKLLEHATGATVLSVSRIQLGKIGIPIPTEDTQKIIINLYKNIKQQNILTKQKTLLQRQLLDGVINKVTK